MEFLFLISSIWILYLLYKGFFKPLKSFKDVVSRGHFLRLIGKKKKERDTYIWALNNIELKTLEKRDISFMLGIWFIKSKNCSEAITFFDKSFENYHDDFYYKKEFGQILNAYLECDEEEKAKNLLNFFIARKNFDKKFIKLEKKYNFLL